LQTDKYVLIDVQVCIKKSAFLYVMVDLFIEK